MTNPSPLHSEIKQLTRGKSSAYFSVKILRQSTIEYLVGAAASLKGAEIPVGNQTLSASLSDFTFTSVGDPRFVMQANAPAGTLDYDVNGRFRINVIIFPRGHAAEVISTVSFAVSSITMGVSASINNLVIEWVDFTSVPQVTRSPGADQIIRNAGLDPLDAARIEGHIAYGAVSNAVSATMGQRREFPLSTLFPCMNFDTPISLQPVAAGAYAAIIPTDFTLNEASHCACESGPDLRVSPTDDSNVTSPNNPGPDVEIGSIMIGGPMPDGVDPKKDLGNRGLGSGECGLMLTETVLRSMVVKVLPALQIDVSEGGLIGYRSTGSVGFETPIFSLDEQDGGVVVRIAFNIEIQAHCWVNLGCFKFPIGHAAILQKGKPYVETAFYPYVDSVGDIKLKGTLKAIDMGTFIVIILGIGTFLSLIGIGAFVGFLVDTAFGLIVRHNLPIKLREQVAKFIGSGEWKLINGSELIKKTIGPSAPPSARYDVDNTGGAGVDSMLISFERRG